ncbi:MAG TPA: flagellar basal body-associated FliL family protein [Hyphomicrobium sp.]|nr:flagellar basal body-associated FliL family protein [Hyphomicrobium sp.]
MAKEPKAGTSKGGGGIVGIILVTLLAVGAGAGFGFFLHGQRAGVGEAEAKPAEEKKVSKPTMSSSASVVMMNPIVVNLAEPANTWVRIEASILLENMPSGGDALAAQLSEDLTAYLRTATLRQFEGPSGFQNMREDFLDRASIRDREHIKDVIIHGVVIE